METKAQPFFAVVRFLRGLARSLRGRVRTTAFSFLERRGRVTYLSSSHLIENESYGAVPLRSSEHVRIQRPIALRREDARPHDALVGSWNLRAPWYAVFQNACLVGRAAVGTSAEGMIIGETIMPENYAMHRAQIPLGPILRGTGRRTHSDLDVACSMTGVWSKEYFHWLTEYLPRLEAVERFTSDSGERPTLIVDSDFLNWQRESLSLLGYGDKDLWGWKGDATRVRRLVIPSFPKRRFEPSREYGALSPAALTWLRTTVLSRVPGPHPTSSSRRLYVSRRGAAGRRVVNEDQVMEILARRGFELIVPHGLSFGEQALLFSSAEAVVGPHGAGMANMLFGDGMRVVELFSSYWNPGLFMVAAARAFTYGVMKCGAEWTLHPHRHNLRVSTDDLERMLDAMSL
jgi:prepilin-type processing-associated H-X9-DG protein